MKTKKTIDFIKRGSLSLPTFLLSNYKKLKITSEELIMLIYLLNIKEDILFDVKGIASNIGESVEKTFELVNALIEKNLLKIKVKKDGGKTMECLELDPFYNKLSSLIIEEPNEDAKEIYVIFEKEFGRSLSPIEFELINSWLEDGHSEEMICLALKEAVLNNVHSLKYIDKILFDWKKKGYKKGSDIKTVKKDLTPDKKDLFEYNWLDDNE